MKRAILIVAVLLALCAGCNEGQTRLTTWGLYDTQTAGARIGVENAANEVGLYGAWRPDPEQPPSMFGVYGLHNFPSLDVNNPTPIVWLPAKWTATPYAGGYVTIDFAEYLALPETTQDRRTLGGPMVGVKFFDLLTTELRYQLANDSLEASFDDQEFVFAIGLFKRW